MDATRIHQDLSLDRSEEHTSELQSQSTISYAVFSLKKKKQKKKKKTEIEGTGVADAVVLGEAVKV